MSLTAMIATTATTAYRYDDHGLRFDNDHDDYSHDDNLIVIVTVKSLLQVFPITNVDLNLEGVVAAQANVLAVDEDHRAVVDDYRFDGAFDDNDGERRSPCHSYRGRRRRCLSPGHRADCGWRVCP